jgi:YidC/Oxa1 family membrane protein insertase
MSVLAPISHALAAVLAGAHAGLTSLGADPGAGLTWVLCLAAVVVVVRLCLLPVAVHVVRLAHASARARPQLRELARRYQGRRDEASVRELMQERRRITTEHRMSRLGCLPMLAQLPVWIALYHLVADVAAGTPVGLVDSGLVASLGSATLVGVPLAERGYLGAGPTHLAVVAGLAGTAAVLAFLTQRVFVAQNMAQNTVLVDVPEVMARTQQLLPLVSSLGLLLVGGFVPVALLVYWVCSQAWTLAWSAAVWRWWPTPGSAAAARRG